jgi:hypothetical protein
MAILKEELPGTLAGIGKKINSHPSLLQNVAAGFSLRVHRLESLCHRGLIYQPRKIFSL